MIYQSLKKIDDYRLIELLNKFLWNMRSTNPESISRYKAVREECVSRGLLQSSDGRGWRRDQCQSEI